MHFVEFWHGVTGHDPRWLYIDSQVVDYPELSRIAARGIYFITIRRRGAAILRRLEAPPRARRGAAPCWIRRGGAIRRSVTSMSR
jgi:hypothetical protein